ncbi:MAG: HD domain-containing phosphohydrolase [Burkholderiaceae bacterium]
MSLTDSPTDSAAGTLPAATAADTPGKLLDAMVLGMAGMAEPGEGGHHIQRIQLFVQTLAMQLRAAEPYAKGWTDDVIDAMMSGAALHDIGNSAVPDRILLKPGTLDAQEFAVVRTHPVIGRDIIDQIRRNAGVELPFLEFAHQIAYGHHERWDGKGYPQGLDGEHNPAPARLMAIADAYDALTSDRVYRAGVPHNRAVQLIFQERGGQFAPDMVDAFIEVQFAFQDIARQNADTEHDLQKKIDYLANAIAESP